VKVSYRASRDGMVVVLHRKTETDSKIQFDRITEELSQKVRDYGAPFEMGYAGPGPQQLALAMLLDAYSTSAETGQLVPLERLPDAARDLMMQHLSASALSIDAQVVEFPVETILAFLRRTPSHG
jgi:hypothetical protein